MWLLFAGTFLVAGALSWVYAHFSLGKQRRSGPPAPPPPIVVAGVQLRRCRDRSSLSRVQLSRSGRSVGHPARSNPSALSRRKDGQERPLGLPKRRRLAAAPAALLRPLGPRAGRPEQPALPAECRGRSDDRRLRQRPPAGVPLLSRIQRLWTLPIASAHPTVCCNPASPCSRASPEGSLPRVAAGASLAVGLDLPGRALDIRRDLSRDLPTPTR